jgi:hypothetical protein
VSVGLLLPCVRFEVEVQPYSEDQPTPLEQAALLFICAEHISHPPITSDLASFLCIGKTATNDLVRDLWYRGWVHLDPTSGVISLHPYVAGYAQKGNFSGMGSVQPPDTLDFIYDLVGGRVAPFPGESVLRDAGPSAFTFPKIRHLGDSDGERFFEMPLAGFMNASQSELIEALTDHATFRDYLKDADPSALHCRPLRPIEKLRPANVRYYRVYFDAFRTGEGEIALEVNDTRPVQRKLGRALCDAIVAVLPFAPRLRQTLDKNATGRQPDVEVQKRALQAFVDRTRADLAQALGVSEVVQEADVADLWRDAREHVVGLVSGRVDLERSSALPDRAAVRGALISALSSDATQTITTSLRISYKALALEHPILDSAKNPGEASILSGLEMRRREGTLFVQTTTATLQDALGAMPPASDRFHFSVVSLDGPHTAASVAVFDHADVLLASESLLGEEDAMGLRLSFSSDNGGTLPGLSTRRLLQRLARDFGSKAGAPEMVVVIPEEQVRIAELPDNLAQLIAHLDRDLALLEEDEPGAASDMDPSPADLAKHRLRLRERWEQAEALADWVERHSEAAEILIDADIHDHAIGLLRETALADPMIVGLSTPADLRENTSFMSVLRNRLQQPGCGPLLLCLPGDPRQQSLVEAVRQDMLSFPQVTLQLSSRNARWGFGFVIAPRESLIGSDGVGRRVVNIGRGRRGTQIGFLLHGARLRDMALDTLSRTHDLSVIRATFASTLFTSIEEEPQRPSFDLSTLLARWLAIEAPLFDGNMGTSLVAPFLEEHPGMPWHPQDTLLEFFPADLRRAILKAAAMSGITNARQVLAQNHWKNGDLLHAATLADDLPGTCLSVPELRMMCLAVATGETYDGVPPEELLLSGDYLHRKAFIVLTALLMLEGRGDSLVPWLNAGPSQSDGGFILNDTPLERLVAALLERATTLPASAVTFAKVDTNEDPQRFSEVWAELATYLEQHRGVSHASSSVVAVRNTLYNYTNNMTKALTDIVLRRGPEMNEEARIAALRRLRTAHADLFGDDPEHADFLLDERRRENTIRAYFETQHEAAQVRYGVVPIARNLRAHWRGQVAYIFDALLRLTVAEQHARPDRELERRVLHAAREWHRAEVRAEPEDADLRPLIIALQQRTSPPFARYPRLTPPWAVPLAAAAHAPDWPARRAALMSMEFPANPSALRRVAAWGRTTKNDVQDYFDGQRLWVSLWTMLERCGRLPAALREEAELDAVLKVFRARLRNIRDELSNSVGGLRRQKARNDLVSADFDRLAVIFKNAWTSFDKLDNPAAPLPPLAAAKPMRQAQAVAAAMREAYDAELRDSTDRLVRKVSDDEHRTDGVARGGKARIDYIEELCSLDRLDVARWYFDNAAIFEGTATRPPPESAHQSRFLLHLRRARRQEDAAKMRHDFRNEVVQEEAALDLLEMLGHLLFPASPAPRRPGASQLFAVLASFVGTTLGRRDLAQEDELCWRLTSSSPVLISLAPFLVREHQGVRCLTIVVPKGAEATRIFLDRLSERHHTTWRSVVFGRAEMSGLQTTREPAAEAGLAGLRALLSDPVDATAPQIVPLTLTFFQADTSDRAPSLTHLDLINLVGLNPIDRRHAITRRVARQVMTGNFISWWDGSFDSSDLSTMSRDTQDQHKRRLCEQLLETSWNELEESAQNLSNLTRLVVRVADRLNIRLSAFSQTESQRGESDVYTLACLTFFSSGNLLNALDLLFNSVVEGRHDRRYLDITPVMRDLRHDSEPGRRLLLRSLPRELHPDEAVGWSRVRSVMEALELATTENRILDLNAVEDILQQDEACLPLLGKWLQLGLQAGLIKKWGAGYAVNPSNGLISLLRML